MVLIFHLYLWILKTRKIIARNKGSKFPIIVGLKVAFGPLFPTANNFSCIGIGFMHERDYKKPTRKGGSYVIFLDSNIEHRTSGIIM